MINIIGAGLAGSEAALQIAAHKIPVNLYEMKPHKQTPAHKLTDFAELVCSNSLRAARVENAVGLLKYELRRLGSYLIAAADRHQVPAGGALAVDRHEFAKDITSQIQNNPYITVHSEEITKVPDQGIWIIATGPLTQGDLFNSLRTKFGMEELHFFDAAAPIVHLESLDMAKIFAGSRYGKGGDDYLNCPMNKEEYLAFYQALLTAEQAEVKDFDREIVFEGCMPIETMAKRGEDTMRFGPLKPVGLTDPRTGKEPYACVQLRQDNRQGDLYNLVGFQTRLRQGEQKRVFGMIPGLENAAFLRYGVMHRNSFLNSPLLLNNTYNLKTENNIFFAGQITGVEGYVESIASGLVAAINAVKYHENLPEVSFPSTTIIGSMAAYISDPLVKKFQPMNANFGLIAPFGERINKRNRPYYIVKRAKESLEPIALRIENERLLNVNPALEIPLPDLAQPKRRRFNS